MVLSNLTQATVYFGPSYNDEHHQRNTTSTVKHVKYGDGMGCHYQFLFIYFMFWGGGVKVDMIMIKLQIPHSKISLSYDLSLIK